MERAMTKGIDRSVLLVRTGRTVWDEAGRLAGSSDLPLCDEGVERARSMAESIGAEGSLSAILCASDEASLETSRALASRCGGRVRVVKGLGEVGLGLWEGLTPAELVEKYPKAYKKWRADPSGVKIPQGEPLNEAQVRVMRSLHRALERFRASQRVGVVLRPLAFALALGSIDDRPISSMWELFEDQPVRWWSVRQERSRLGLGGRVLGQPGAKLGKAS